MFLYLINFIFRLRLKFCVILLSISNKPCLLSDCKFIDTNLLAMNRESKQWIWVEQKKEFFWDEVQMLLMYIWTGHKLAWVWDNWEENIIVGFKFWFGLWWEERMVRGGGGGRGQWFHPHSKGCQWWVENVTDELKLNELKS